MRSFRLPTRIDGCYNMTTFLNATTNASLLYETTASTSLVQTIVKCVEYFKTGINTPNRLAGLVRSLDSMA